MTIIEEVSDLDELIVANLGWLIPDMYRAAYDAQHQLGRNDVAVVMLVNAKGDEGRPYYGPTAQMMGALCDRELFLATYVIGGEAAIENLWGGVPDPGHVWVLVVHGFHVYSILLKLKTMVN